MESGCSKKLEEEKLELRLGPPGQEDRSRFIKNSHQERDEALLSFGYFPSMKSNANQAQKFPPSEDRRVGSVLASPWAKNHHQNQPEHTAMPPNCSQKRIASGPVVGWPPVRSFRKNHGTPSSSKPASDPPRGLPHKIASEKKPAGTEPNVKGLFVKINMDGVPIGRKIDLKAYDSYDKLSTAVDELFMRLLAAQRDPSAGRVMNKQEEEKPITGVLDGNGEYTLVYEDNEGDRMLVGDVPWHMFVSTVKRLRVLKSSELSAVNLGSSKKGKTGGS
ncbi:Auxin-responsive protein IAA26 [Hibiscus syriacus]|uniref:Auxin-responsive protein n=1 Tax=Hibiscus syriacus TaxID=106335 RepID=A0A6A3C501_HIBSY|nr:auxin-responsive protein IAA26-like [Hibiscus syriacus]KAE8724275.1 Auxin-responsive protein IAA26 [Hibiscus syriacus]